jgi:hypothetical protein
MRLCEVRIPSIALGWRQFDGIEDPMLRPPVKSDWDGLKSFVPLLFAQIN